MAVPPRRTDVRLSPQSLGSDVGAFTERFELGPDHVLSNPLPARERAETAVRSRDDPFLVAECVHNCLDALRDLYAGPADSLEHLIARLELRAGSSPKLARKVGAITFIILEGMA